MEYLDKKQRQVTEKALLTVMKQIKQSFPIVGIESNFQLQDIIQHILDQVFSIGYFYGKREHRVQSKINRVCHKVYQYNSNNKLVDTYNSLSEASRVTGFHREMIKKAAEGNHLYKGYFFEIEKGSDTQ